MDNNVQIKFHPPFITVYWQKEQIKVNLSESNNYRINYVQGPSFLFRYQYGEMKKVIYTKDNIQRVWEKNKTGRWIKAWTTLEGRNPGISITNNTLNYTRDYRLYNIAVKYNLRSQKGTGQVYFHDKYLIKWIGIMNPLVRIINGRKFKI